MGDGMEILLWLAIMAVVGIRGAAQARKRSEQEQADEPPVVPPSAGDAHVAARDRVQTASPARSGSARKGVLERMMEYAVEMERQAEARQAEVAARQAEAVSRQAEAVSRQAEAVSRQTEAVSRRTEADRRTRTEALRSGGEVEVYRREDRERTVVVPGRRVRPSPLARRDDAPEETHAPSEEDPDAPRRRPRRPGLERLERYPTLRRAIVLSEVLGPPPGLEDGTTPIGRRWSED